MIFYILLKIKLLYVCKTLYTFENKTLKEDIKKLFRTPSQQD